MFNLKQFQLGSAENAFPGVENLFSVGFLPVEWNMKSVNVDARQVNFTNNSHVKFNRTNFFASASSVSTFVLALLSSNSWLASLIIFAFAASSFDDTLSRPMALNVYMIKKRRREQESNENIVLSLQFDGTLIFWWFLMASFTSLVLKQNEIDLITNDYLAQLFLIDKTSRWFLHHEFYIRTDNQLKCLLISSYMTMISFVK